jgi:hypothetical protein
MSAQNNSDESVFEVTLTGYEARYELVTLEPVTVFNMRVRYRNETWETSRRVRVWLFAIRAAFVVVKGVRNFPNSGPIFVVLSTLAR